ncbi:transcription termination factor NusA [Candidatus Daviesbacteria bacterium RIFCSPHIGHO2_12_FULL_37_16]|uniref:Transcription termination/antitermination protein NusA n=3 Tax=Candidatus Daviesiibacteriota TaxID=1752718 RepID=A0A0G0H954_9BACT|nr:MAG: NusA antitermination factor [Candidatus Daviesbacteria bacterium GW2011_GWB1_36_5]KKQ16268.1 MAG: NusA antitermination factor [Candidatus Daviesbacteria bacterium GW2011_GWA1_36_8]OGE36734.1 MAG: transcription termination factor NusA [Candidatus Daviesbacteria bacterium RIFCSPHIGHO2_12_FULL_37_16]
MPIQARTEFAAAINQIASEKGVEVDVILDAIQQAALAAYRKDLSFRNEPVPDDFEELTAKLDPATGEISIWRGSENITPPGFARIAAQTAKQVITQKLHEAEKGAIVSEYEQKVGTIVSGAVQRQEGNTYFVDLGRAEGILPPPEQVRDELYSQNQRMKFYIKEIRESGRGPEVVVSRTDSGLVKGLFAMEVPEVASGVVEIKEIAREPGGRTKVAVVSSQDGVDPVGSMVGQKGVRVQAVINELGEEKIDIVMHSEDPARFIAASLSPAKDIQVQLNEEEKVATVTIPDSQLSLAIGKGGQNVRLAAKLTGWKIDIVGTGEGLEEESKVEEKVSKEGKVSDVSNAEKTEDTKIAEPAQAEVTPADVPAAEPVAEPEVQEESKVEEVAPAAEAEAPVSTEKKTDQAQEDEPKA